MPNPTPLDLLFLKIQPRYLYKGKRLQNVADTPVAMLHLVSPQEHIWKFMDYLTLKKMSTLIFRGTVKQLKMAGELDPKALIFEVIEGFSDRTVNPGDILMIDKSVMSLFDNAPAS